MTPVLSAPLLIPMRNWPELDRQLWAAAFVKRGPLARRAYGTELRPTTVYFAERAYSRWLSVLAAAQVLDPLVLPGDRATPDNLCLFLQALRDGGNIDNTMAARIWGVRMALQIMQPGTDFRWLTSPDGHNINSLLPAVQRELFTPDSLELFKWGFELIDLAALQTDPEARRTLHRNGIMIAILAALAPRLRTLAAMQLGRHIWRNGAVFRLSFEYEDLKYDKPLAYDIPARLTPAIERYLATERLELLDGRVHDWFWVGRGGEPLEIRGIEGVMRRASAARFGQVFGAHRFRHALMTTFATRDPAHANAAAAILGNSGPVAEKYYNRAKQADAARRTNIGLEEDREETRLLAQQLFMTRDDFSLAAPVPRAVSSKPNPTPPWKSSLETLLAPDTGSISAVTAICW